MSVLCFFGNSLVLRFVSFILRSASELSASILVLRSLGSSSKSCLASLTLDLASESSTLILALCSLPKSLSIASPADLASRLTFSAFFLKEPSMSLPAFLPIFSTIWSTSLVSDRTFSTGISMSILIVPSAISYLLSLLDLVTNRTCWTSYYCSKLVALIPFQS